MRINCHDQLCIRCKGSLPSIVRLESTTRVLLTVRKKRQYYGALRLLHVTREDLIGLQWIWVGLAPHGLDTCCKQWVDEQYRRCSLFKDFTRGAEPGSNGKQLWTSELAHIGIFVSSISSPLLLDGSLIRPPHHESPGQGRGISPWVPRPFEVKF